MPVLAEGFDEREPGTAAAVRARCAPDVGLPMPLLIAGPLDLAAQIVAAIDPADGRFAATAVHPPSPRQLLKAFERHAPRIAVLDVDLCHAFGSVALRGLRRAVPDMTWLAGWTVPTEGSLDVLIEGRMRGGLAWSDPPVRAAQALAAVCAGEMWFPRAVMQALYVTVCSRSEAWISRPEEDLPTPDSSLVLTLREREVVELAREGLTNKAIARLLQVCPDTVKKHLAAAYEKLQVHKRRQIVL